MAKIEFPLGDKPPIAVFFGGDWSGFQSAQQEFIQEFMAYLKRLGDMREISLYGITDTLCCDIFEQKRHIVWRQSFNCVIRLKAVTYNISKEQSHTMFILGHAITAQMNGATLDAICSAAECTIIDLGSSDMKHIFSTVLPRMFVLPALR